MLVTSVPALLISIGRRLPDRLFEVSAKRSAKESVLPCTAKKKLSIVFCKIISVVIFLSCLKR